MADQRKRPRIDTNDTTSNPTISLLQTQLAQLQSELSHSQSIRSIERKNALQSEKRYKRQLADAYEEISQNKELVDSLRDEVDNHSKIMEESRKEWLHRIQWYEENANSNNNSKRKGSYDSDGCSYDSDEDSTSEEDSASKHKIKLLQEKLQATTNQVTELEIALKDARDTQVEAEERATELRCAAIKEPEIVDENNKPEIIPRDLRIKIAEVERTNRTLTRENNILKNRCADMVQYKERVSSSQRKISQLEKEVQSLTHLVEEGKEVNRQWMGFRNDIVLEDFNLDGDLKDDSKLDMEVGGTAVPPEISTVVRKFQQLKRTISNKSTEITKLTSQSSSHTRRIQLLETQLQSKSQNILTLEKTINDQEVAMNTLELENRKIIAQQNIWKREADGLRSLLDTYEQQESVLSSKNMSPKLKVKGGNSGGTNTEGLELSLKSARDEIQLLSNTNTKLESTIEVLRLEQQSAKVEHERVLEKFGKLRTALMDERSKAEKAEARAVQAETLAGKGSYNNETTRVLHLKDNPLLDAVRSKYQGEIDILKQRLEEVESSGGGGASTPATKNDRGSFGSAKSNDSSSAVDVQKLHSRLKEQFRNQIALFRQGVYLITGYKIDMMSKDNETQIFTVKSVYFEREDDSIMFKWNPKKKKDKLDMLSTDMAHLLMKGSSGVYVKDHGSWPGFMASVTLQLFDDTTTL